jgi:hypothetical protein
MWASPPQQCGLFAASQSSIQGQRSVYAAFPTATTSRQGSAGCCFAIVWHKGTPLRTVYRGQSTLYNKEAKAPSCLGHAHELTILHPTCTYTYAANKPRFEAAQWTCSTAASETLGPPFANTAWSQIISKQLALARMVLLPSWFAVLSFAWLRKSGFKEQPWMYPCDDV